MPTSKEHNSILPEQLHSMRKSRGFTLLELLIVLLIIGALAAITIPIYSNYVDKAKVTVAVATLDTIRKTLEDFHIDNQRYPENIDQFGKETPGSGITVFSNTLIDQINKDLSNVNYSLNPITRDYILTAEARDKKNTPLTMTLSGTTK